MRVIFPLLFALLLMAGCKTDAGSSTTSNSNNTTATTSAKVDKAALSKEISTAENALYNVDNFTFDPVKANAVVMGYDKFVKNFPNDPKTPDYLFKSGEIYRSLKKFDKAIASYENICNNHKDFEKAPHSLFLMGFSYENDLKNTDKAKATYQKFLTQHPKHELAKDVKFSLDNLGRSPEDIIKEFEKNNKK